MLRMRDHRNASNDYDRAKELRVSAPMAERLVWNALSQSARAAGSKFRKQYPLHPYIVDFVCLKAKLVIELDGLSHDARQGYDAARTACLEKAGYIVMRFTNEEVRENLDGVVMTIIEKAAALIAQNNAGDGLLSAPSPNPSREGRGADRSATDISFSNSSAIESE